MAEEIRIGVYVCDCGSNIAGVVDVPRVVHYAKGLPHVVFAEEGRWSCSSDYLASMKDSIQEHRINRVVVASCTPRTHEPLFKRTVKEAGINPYLLEFVSIREQVSWVHMQEPEVATQKAQDLVRMGVAKAALLEPGEEIRLPVGRSSLVIGGGMAGMSAALTLAEQGFSVHLVEREPELGGLLRKLWRISYDHGQMQAQELLAQKAEAVKAHPRITVHTGAEVQAMEGYIGHYRVSLQKGPQTESVEASTVIVATGMEEIEPLGLFEYGKDGRVITQLQLEGLLGRWQSQRPDDKMRRVVMINCVLSKNSERGCCNIGCPVSVKNALALKELRPEMEVYVLYRDLSLVKEERGDLEKARKAGVCFIRFPEERYPEVEAEPEHLRVRVRDLLMGEDLEIFSDLLVLTTALKGSSSADGLKGLLKVSTNPDGFFQEAHVKLGPVDFAADGLYLCGGARSPKGLKETMDEAMASAMRAAIPMQRGYVEAEGIVADVDLEACNACGLCYKRCPYGAIKVREDKRPEILKALCKGCGLCAADCPKECIQIVHFSDEQILAQVDAALEQDPGEKIIGFVCHWCALGGVDMAGVSRLQYPPHARLIRVMCSARVSVRFILRAFERGAAGVLVAGCEFPTCHYISGNYAAEKRLNRTRKILAKRGYDPGRLWNVWCSAADGPKFARTMREMIASLGLADPQEEGEGRCLKTSGEMYILRPS